MSEALTLPFSGKTSLSRHHSAMASQDAARTRGKRTLEYLDLLLRIGPDGICDHDAAKALGLPLQSINSIRNGLGERIATVDRECISPFGKRVTAWRLK